MIAENQKLVTIRRDERERTCIVCPIGCRLTIDVNDDRTLSVSGNRCKRGKEYAEEEFRDPRRTVTATCAIRGAAVARLPVRSSAGVPVDAIAGFLARVYELRLDAPVSRATVLLSDVDGSGVDLVATATMERVDAEQEEDDG
ncbi:MAG: DUF1667 domain-containing protein [Spirochaetaceae bacterium]|nr:MAG: DUF1667 domain-containing protein [Spirochaetaceae bacterium]